MLAIVAAIAAATAAGVWAERRYGAAAGVATRRALLVVLYGLLPPVTFFNLAAAEISVDAGIGIVLSFVALALLTLLAWLVAARALRLPRASVGAVVLAVMTANTGYLGYAVVATVLGFDALGEAAAYDVLVSAPALYLGAFAVGAAFGASAGEGPGERLRAFFTRNPALYAAIAALLVPDSFAPDLLVDASRVAVVAVLPVGFFAVGVALAEESEEGQVAFPPRFDAAVGATVLLRLVGAPLLLFALAAPLIEIPDAYLLLAAMPCGINTIVVSHAYGLDLRIAAGAIAWSTTIAVAALTVGALAGVP